MNLGLDNTLRLIRDLVTGDGGFARDIPMPPAAMTLDGATRGVETNSQPADVIIFDADAELALMSITLPRDFDEDADTLKMAVKVRYVSGTSISLQFSAASRQRGSADPVAMPSFVAPDKVVIDNSEAVHTMSLDLNGLGHRAGDTITVRIVASDRTSTGIAHLLGGTITLHSDLVSHDMSAEARDERTP